jgi:hypothetical protein
MTSMNRVFRLSILATFSFASLTTGAAAQTQNGSVEFAAGAAPTGGVEEPVRGFPFFLLSKSFEEINKEADADVPKPDMDAFIDKLEVSNDL